MHDVFSGAIPPAKPPPAEIDTATVRKIVQEETTDFARQSDLEALRQEVNAGLKSLGDNLDAVKAMIEEIKGITGQVKENAVHIGENARQITHLNTKLDFLVETNTTFMNGVKTDRAAHLAMTNGNSERLSALDMQVDGLGEQSVTMAAVLNRMEPTVATILPTVHGWIFGEGENGNPSMFRQLEKAKLEWRMFGDNMVATLNTKLAEIADDYNLLVAQVQQNTHFRERWGTITDFAANSIGKGTGYLRSNWKRLALKGALILLVGGGGAGGIKLLEILVN